MRSSSAIARTPQGRNTYDVLATLVRGDHSDSHLVTISDEFGDLPRVRVGEEQFLLLPRQRIAPHPSCIVVPLPTSP